MKIKSLNQLYNMVMDMVRESGYTPIFSGGTLGNDYNEMSLQYKKEDNTIIIECRYFVDDTYEVVLRLGQYKYFTFNEYPFNLSLKDLRDYL